MMCYAMRFLMWTSRLCALAGAVAELFENRPGKDIAIRSGGEVICDS